MLNTEKLFGYVSVVLIVLIIGLMIFVGISAITVITYSFGRIRIFLLN